MKTKKLILPLVLAAALLFSACSLTGKPASQNGNQNQSPVSGEQKSAAKNQVVIQNFSFQPAKITIAKGEAVIWTNEDSAPHQIASDNNAFSGNAISKGQTYSFTFNEPGEYPYHCAIHPSMLGKITVK